MKKYVFPLKKRTAQSTWRGVVHAVKSALYRKHDMGFQLKNIPLTYWVLPGTYFSKHLSKFGSYEAENSNWILDNFLGGQGRLFVDVGANFGWYSMIFSLCAGSTGQVVAIEPEPGNLRLLTKNKAVNHADNVKIIASGVGEKAGNAELFLNAKSNPGMHSLRQNITSTDKVSIKISTLDDLLRDVPGDIDLLKMDIEGFEVDALLGATETLARTRRVLVEFSPGFIRACGRDPLQLLALFERQHFRPYLMKSGQLQATDMAYLSALDEHLAHMKNPQADIFYLKS